MLEQTNTKTLSAAANWLGWTICTLGAIFYCYEYILRITPSVMMDELMGSFGLNAYGFGVLVGLYYDAYTPMQAVVGVTHDLYGPRRTLTFAIITCIIGNLLFSTTHSIYIAGIGRFLIGFGSAFAFVGVLKLAAVWLPANRFAMIAGLTTSLGMIGGMFGNMGLMHFVQNVGWRETLNMGTVLGIIILPLIWFVIRDDSSASTDQQIKIKKLTFKETLWNLADIVKNPQMWICGFVGCMLYASLSVFAEIYGNSFIHSVSGIVEQKAANANSMVYFGWLLGGPLFGWLSDRLRRRKLPLVLGCILSAIAFLLLLYLPQINYYLTLMLLFLFGFFASAEVICFAVGREISHPKLAATSVAFVNMVVMLAGMIFQPLVGKLLDLGWDGAIQNGVHSYSAQDFKTALLIIPIGLIIATIIMLGLRETKAQVQGQ